MEESRRTLIVASALQLLYLAAGLLWRQCGSQLKYDEPWQSSRGDSGAAERDGNSPWVQDGCFTQQAVSAC